MTSKTERAGDATLPDPMRRRAVRRWMAAGGAAAAAAAAAGAGWWQASQAAAPADFADTRLPDVPLVTHDGRKVRFYSDLVQGKLVLINMMYAQCSSRCPAMTQNLRRVHESLGDRVGRDVFMYSISLLPEYDRPADLKAYMQQQGVGPHWTFLTGQKEHVERLRRALGFSDPDPERDADINRHTGMVRIGNDALDRWAMAPALVSPGYILECLMAVDPVMREAGRVPLA